MTIPFKLSLSLLLFAGAKKIAPKRFRFQGEQMSVLPPKFKAPFNALHSAATEIYSSIAFPYNVGITVKSTYTMFDSTAQGLPSTHCSRKLSPAASSLCIANSDDKKSINQIVCTPPCHRLLHMIYSHYIIIHATLSIAKNMQVTWQREQLTAFYLN